MRRKVSKKLRKAATAMSMINDSLDPKREYKKLKSIHKSLPHNAKNPR